MVGSKLKKAILVFDDKGCIRLLDEKGKEMRVFFVHDDSDAALILLKKINKISTKSGKLIYENGKYKNFFIWSFYQQWLYNSVLRDYVKFQELIHFFYDHKDKFIVDIPDNLESVFHYLNILGVKISLSNAIRYRYKKLTGKSIIFAGLIFSSLINFLAIIKMVFKKPTVLVYSPDKYHIASGGDFRIATVYNFFKKHNINYLEIFHSTYGKEFFSNLFVRSRLSLYLEGFSPLFFLKKDNNQYNLESFELFNQPIVNHFLCVLDRKLKFSLARIKILEFLLKFSKINTLITIDDPRYAQEVALACKLNNIKIFAFQHGHITKYHAGWMNYEIPAFASVPFDKFYVWNDYWKRSLILNSTYYNEKNVFSGGPLRTPPEISFKKHTNKIDKFSELNIIIPYESVAPKAEIKKVICRLLFLGAKLFFKVRPDISIDKQLQEYGVTTNQVKIIEKIDAKFLSQIDVAIGLYTTFLYDMIFYEKPVFIISSKFKLGNQLVEDGLADFIESDFEVDLLLEKIKNFISKKYIAWPAAPNIDLTLNKILLS